MDALAYARQLRQLLPQGSLWPESEGSVLGRLLQGLGEELARVEARALDLLREWDPQTTDECLADWERVFGLPDSCYGAEASTTERRNAVVQKYLSQGGATPAYFVEVAGRLGFTVTVVELGASAWRLDVEPGDYEVTSSVFRSGNRINRRLVSVSTGSLECVIERLKPAHTVVTFNYL